MGGGHNGFGIDDAATTEVGALGGLDGDLVGMAFDGGSLTVDDPSEGEFVVRTGLAGGTEGDQRQNTQ